jgi:hypothetical protein
MGIEDRSALHAYLSVDSHASWQRFSEANGISITSLLEVLGLELEEEMRRTDPDDLRQPWVKAARRIDAIRRRRGR